MILCVRKPFAFLLASPLALAATTLAMCASGSVVTAQSLSGLGLPAGAMSSISRALSADGSVVVGLAGTSAGLAGFRWTSAGGMQDLGVFPGSTYTAPQSVSDDGAVVTGAGDTAGGLRAFRWSGASGMVEVVGLPGTNQSLGFDANADGSVLVGVCNATNGYSAFRWTQAGGMLSLGTLPGGAISYAYGVNADGSVVVGDSYDSPLWNVAYRWTSAGGMQSLGRLPGGAYSYAYAVSADGLVVVGDSDSPIGDIAYRWTAAGGMVSLGTLPVPFAYMLSTAVNADGSVIVGATVSSFSGAPGLAFLWTAPLGIVDLNTYLPTLGIDLTGWTLTDAAGVSADGRIIAGTGTHNGVDEAWIATLSGTHGTPFCFGDGSAGACPCGNSGTAGRGCQNSVLTGGAVLAAAGSASLASDTLVLTSSGELPTVLSIFLQGDTSIAPAHFGDGLRCTGGSLKRLYARSASAGVVAAPPPGTPSISARSAALGDVIAAGTTRYYQTYYRDSNASFCANPPGNAWNVSNGLATFWRP